MIIRFRSKSGMVRVSADPAQAFSDALQDATAQFAFSGGDLYVNNSPGEKGKPATDFAGKLVSDLGLKNGDILFLHLETSDLAVPEAGAAGGPVTAVAQSVNGTIAISGEEISDIVGQNAKLSQLPVDDLLDKQEGMILRPKLYMCRHGEKGMCEYCSPLPPWNRDYLDEYGVKHKSFHAHVKELNEQQNNRASGLSYIAPLKGPDYSIDLRCANGHSPYPKGICSKCQPAPITLQQQKFRMVDHLEYADHTILNKFIDTWRQSGVQPYGVLYGRYEPYEKVPLGIKAVVEAIFEPPQASELDGVTLLEWKDEELVDKVAGGLGLYKVGVVFTDLTDAKTSDGKVLCKRHKDSFFLSCVEAIMAARNQVRYPNVTQWAKSGRFSSKFVTCVITGGLEGEIEPRAYQVSASAEALVKADDISASTHPNMIHIKETSGTRYVPDVFYSKINEYGLEVKENAKPAFPVDFLLVTLLDSFPLAPEPMFVLQFPIEARDFIGELQNTQAVQTQLLLGNGDLSNLRDFHFLVYLINMEILSGDEIDLLLRCVKDKKTEDYVALLESGGWMTLLTILEHSA
ncbi:nuclear protein localization factor and ER translocation component [Metschnikowia bicuspidata var. bicuspidata NRRL YB-4993]|uniref:Nuclear protein localization protein 4 n=1 Tax=Metschnikowia bicuspidata var. bicuspidata NRRL YB-4993 TaxID=869754 RepID=A0A1A0HJX3_9ASCO|nr:nuclear protein localization factor and ER translocation component [Metschnikowia bicuspidata var. bicuspidata NRRL YB-4993]OBA24301.1 nuclear protein localization factor and ER translocation component [Metschnikowia bicuspidata var. bicuspidata NRRL YB-4993]